MKMIKLILWCSICALIGVVLSKWIFGQTTITSDLTKPLDGKPARIVISGGVSGVWMTIERANRTDQNPVGEGGFDPSYTYIYSDFKPVAKRLKNGKWVIQFTAEIAEGLP